MEKRIVYIVDDDIETRKSLCWLVESVGYDAATYANAKEFLQGYTPNAIGCVILDVRMPDITGFELQETLQEKNIDLPIIFVTAHGDIPMAIRAMKMGAMDFLTKPVNKQLLLESINKSIKQHIENKAQQTDRNKVEVLLASLTPREHDVMELMVRGKINKVIADQLNISPKTVEFHRTKVMQKMQVKTLSALVNLVVKHDLVAVD